MSNYVVLIDPTPDGGFNAWAPDLPGCVALGYTYEDCVDEMREAVGFHLAGLRADGEQVPPATTRAAIIEAA